MSAIFEGDKTDMQRNYCTNPIKRGPDWSFPLSERLIDLIDRFADIIEDNGGKVPHADDDWPLRFEFLNLQRDIMVEARSCLWRSETQQNAIIRYYMFGGFLS